MVGRGGARLNEVRQCGTVSREVRRGGTWSDVVGRGGGRDGARWNNRGRDAARCTDGVELLEMNEGEVKHDTADPSKFADKKQV